MHGGLGSRSYAQGLDTGPHSSCGFTASSKATQALPTPNMARASSLGVRARQRRGGDTWERERAMSFYSGVEAHPG